MTDSLAADAASLPARRRRAAAPSTPPAPVLPARPTSGVLLAPPYPKQFAIEDACDRLLTGDCMEILARLPDRSYDMAFVDPPYYLQLPAKRLLRWDTSRVTGVSEAWDQFGSFEEYDAFTGRWLAHVQRLLKPTGTLWVIGTYHNIHRIGTALQDLGFWVLNDVLWLKSNPMPNFLKVRFTNATETLIWALPSRKSKKYAFDKRAAAEFSDSSLGLNVWRLPLCTGRERLKNGDGLRLHPTQKPEALLERVLRVSTRPGDLVLDPMAGTGTTGVVARRLGRRFTLIEADEGYARAADARLRAMGT